MTAKKPLEESINEAFPMSNQAPPKDDDASFVEPPKGGKFKLSQVGDFIKGKYLGSKPFKGDYGETLIYEIEAEKGEYHENDCGMAEAPAPGGEVTALEAGGRYGVFDHFSFHDAIAQAKVGQRVIVQFTERRASKDRKGKFYKVISCKLDPNFKPDDGLELPDSLR